MIVVSHRGPVRFTREADGTFRATRGAGGVVSGLAPLLADRDDAIWIAAAMSDDDRAASHEGAVSGEAMGVRLLDLDPDLHRLHYDVVSNATIWFLHHGLFDLVHRPRFERRFREAWAAYTEVNRRFAASTAEVAADGDVVLVQDYQLALVPAMLRRMRPDVRIAYFAHTPFMGPNSAHVLPDEIAGQLCGGMAVAPCGFHTRRWARAYEASAHEVLGPDTPIGPTFVAPLGPDAEALRADAHRTDVTEELARLDAQVGERRLVVRVDRIEPSKNLVRGFYAFDTLLASYPQWRGEVVFVAMLNPSRESLPEYLAYRTEVERAADRVNDRWGDADWTPVLVDTRDSFARALAGYRRYDVLFVNPIKDGLNLVAKEGPLLNERDGVLCLSPDAGSWDELRGPALPAHPFDLEQNAAALHTALAMEASERAERAQRLRELGAAHSPRTWLDAQLAAAR